MFLPSFNGLYGVNDLGKNDKTAHRGKSSFLYVKKQNPEILNNKEEVFLPLYIIGLVRCC